MRNSRRITRPCIPHSDPRTPHFRLHGYASLFAILVLCVSPLARGDERGDALVRQAAERLTATIPFVISYTVVVSNGGNAYTSSTNLTLSESFGRGNDSGAPGSTIDIRQLWTNLCPLPAFNGPKTPLQHPPPILSSRYIGRETFEGTSYEVVEVTQPIPQRNDEGESIDDAHPLARARLKWYLDDHRFLKRVHLVRVEPALDAGGNPLPLPAAFQGDIRGQGTVTLLRKTRIVAPRHELSGQQRTLPKYVEPGQDARSRATITVSPDGSLAAQAGSHTMEVLDVSSGRPRFHLELRDQPRGCAFSTDSTKLAIIVGANILLCSTKQSAVEPKPLVIPAIAGMPAFSPDGLHIAAACADRSVHVWSAVTGRVEHVLDHLANVVAFSPDGKRLATFGVGSALQLWDTERWTVERRLDTPMGQSDLFLAFSPDGKWIASATREGEIRLFSCFAEQAIRTWMGVGPIEQIQWSEHGKYLITVDRDGRSDDGSGNAIGLTTWSPATGRMQQTFALPAEPPMAGVSVWEAQVSRDGRYVFYRDNRSLLNVMDRGRE